MIDDVTDIEQLAINNKNKLFTIKVQKQAISIQDEIEIMKNQFFCSPAVSKESQNTPTAAGPQRSVSRGINLMSGAS